jgi:TetR/AcrR family transcriptional repressor of nem operon
MPQEATPTERNAHRERYHRTHDGIVRTAARLLRERGIAGASVDDVMQSAGLTRGGFYAHFRDKTAMVAESLAHAFVEARHNLLDIDATGEDWLAAAVDRYLSDRHVDETGRGCAVPALGADVARGPVEVRATFAVEVEHMIQGVATKLGGGADARARAIGFLSTAAGAVLLARAVTVKSDPSRMRLAREILAAAKKQLLRPR